MAKVVEAASEACYVRSHLALVCTQRESDRVRQRPELKMKQQKVYVPAHDRLAVLLLLCHCEMGCEK
jgi:hypothetical protein